MRDMKEGIKKAIDLYEADEIRKGKCHLTDSQKKLIEHGYIQCALQIGYDIVSKDESFMVGLQEMVLRDSEPLKINEFVKEVGENAVTHGWCEQERNFGELIALCHSELSEALEESRKGRKPTDTYYSGKSYGVEEISLTKQVGYEKPEGIPSELADVIIRIFDMCYYYGIDIENALIEKHEYNKSRPYKHGKQF